MPKHSITLHLCQFASVDREPLKTLEQVQGLLKPLKIKPGDWLVFPEMWPSGFDAATSEKQVVENAFCLQWLKRFAREHRCFLSGSLLEKTSRAAYNSAYVIDPQGKVVAHYRKIHLFQLAGEHRRYAAGKEISVTDFAWGNLGLAICFDLRFPELFRKLSQRKSTLVLVPSAWPLARMDHFHALLRARAIENQCFVAGVNQSASRHSRQVYGGGSQVYGPWGESLGVLKRRAGILSVVLDFRHLERIRREYPFLESRRLS